MTDLTRRGFLAACLAAAVAPAFIKRESLDGLWVPKENKIQYATPEFLKSLPDIETMQRERAEMLHANIKALNKKIDDDVFDALTGQETERYFIRYSDIKKTFVITHKNYAAPGLDVGQKTMVTQYPAKIKQLNSADVIRIHTSDDLWDEVTKIQEVTGKKVDMNAIIKGAMFVHPPKKQVAPSMRKVINSMTLS